MYRAAYWVILTADDDDFDNNRYATEAEAQAVADELGGLVLPVTTDVIAVEG